MIFCLHNDFIPKDLNYISNIMNKMPQKPKQGRSLQIRRPIKNTYYQSQSNGRKRQVRERERERERERSITYECDVMNADKDEDDTGSNEISAESLIQKRKKQVLDNIAQRIAIA